MATQRYISTSFWTDKWIRSLDPSERYLYMYLLTNPQTNIAGIYQITLDRIAFDTGYDERTLRPMLERFSKAGKAYFYKDEWVILPSWPRHQKADKKATIKAGIDCLLHELPDRVIKYSISVGYQYPIGWYQYQPSYSDSDSDSDTDTDTDTDLLGAVAPVENPKPTPDPLYQAIFQSFIGKVGAFTNYPKEANAIKRIIKYCEQHAPRYTNGDKVRLVESVITTFWSLTQNGSTFWRGQPFTPSALSVTGIFDRVLVEIGQSTPGGSNDIPDF